MNKEETTNIIDLKKLKNLFDQQKYKVKQWQSIIENSFITIASWIKDSYLYKIRLLTQPLQVILHFNYQQKRMNFKVNNLKDIFTFGEQKKLEQILKNKSINYQGASYQNYNADFKGLGEQGILGFFRTGKVYQITNFQLRYFLIQKYLNEQKLIQNLYVLLVGMIVDVFTYPLMLIQSKNHNRK